MSSIIQDAVEPVGKKQKAGVYFTDTASGELDESEIPSDDYESHYLYPGENKSSSSYPVVDASDTLRRGNLEAAWQLGARGGVDEDEHKERLRSLGEEFDDNPIPDEEDESARLKQAAGAMGEDSNGEFFERGVAFKATDSDEQIAIGAVLTPNRVDHQGDFFTEATIRDLADGFEDRIDERDAVPGVMHTFFPAEDIELADSHVLEGRMELGERELPRGTWVQAYRFTDDELWSLVDDGILGGYSIGGAIASDSTERYDPGNHPEQVSFPDEVKTALDDAGLSPDEVSVREIRDARVLEVSTVDFPAVPDATHEAYKSHGMAKADARLTGSIVEARLYLEERGHSEEDARRLANYLNEQKAKESGGWIQRAKDFFTPGGAGADSDQPSAILGSTKAGVGAGAKSRSAETPDDDPRGSAADLREDATDLSKAGRTLSDENIRSTMAVHDAALDMLERSDVAHGRMRFTDDRAVDFDEGNYEAAQGAPGTQTTGAESSTGDAAADDSTTTIESMSDDQINELNEKLDTVLERFEDGGEGEASEATQDAEKGEEQSEEKNEQTDETPALKAKVDGLEEKVDTLLENADGDDNETGERLDTLEQAVEDLGATQEQTVEVLSQMADAQGVSQQADLGKSETGSAESSTKAQFLGTDKLTGEN